MFVKTNDSYSSKIFIIRKNCHKTFIICGKKFVNSFLEEHEGLKSSKRNKMMFIGLFLLFSHGSQGMSFFRFDFLFGTSDGHMML